MAFKPVYSLGTLLYYAGLFVMAFGLITFVFGMVSSVSSVMTQVKSMSSNPYEACATIECAAGNQTAEQDIASDFNAAVGDSLGGFVDVFFSAAGLSTLGNDPISAPIFLKAKRFFAMLGLGLAMVVAGTLMRLLESIVDYFDPGKGRKQEMAERYRINWGARSRTLRVDERYRGGYGD